MKTITRDIAVTLTVKLVLLYLLWYFCVRDMNPQLSDSKEWFLGKTAQTEHSPTNQR